MSTISIDFIRKARYSRIQLVLRLFFTNFFIVYPHYIFLIVIQLFKILYKILVGVQALFTGRISKSYIDFIVGFEAWNMRVSASIYDIIDGYPSFGLYRSNKYINIHIDYSQQVNRISVLMRLLFAPILCIPIYILLSLYAVLIPVSLFVANTCVLLTTRYPEFLFSFHARILLLIFNMNLYSSFITPQYPSLFENPRIISQDENTEQIGVSHEEPTL